MNFFQLTIDGVPSGIVCAAPNATMLQAHLDDVGGIGNRLYEIISVLTNFHSSWNITDLRGVLKLDGFSVLQYSIYSDQPEIIEM